MGMLQRDARPQFVGTVRVDSFHCVEVKWEGFPPETGTKLYTLPGALEVPSGPQSEEVRPRHELIGDIVQERKKTYDLRQALQNCLDVFDAIGGTPPNVWETARALLQDANDSPINDSELPEPVERILRFAGKQRNEVSNPNLTAREAIVVANYIKSVHGI